MAKTYKALLQGNQLEWKDAAPPLSNEPLLVYVTVAQTQATLPKQPSGPAMAAILEQLAQRGTFASISDPVAWQRAERSERDLPGRE